ncbi:hypothetical protein J6590_048018 [Homalodisca vitripennis]|nr:hypothetical protein J6590_048018 [Homalodisca vitripennis]
MEFYFRSALRAFHTAIHSVHGCPWTHQTFKFGEYHHLIHDLKLDDNRFKTYFRLNKDEFEEVLSIIDEDILKKDTNCRKAINSRERLALWVDCACASTRMSQADRSESDLCGRVQDVLGHTWMSMYATRYCDSLGLGFGTPNGKNAVMCTHRSDQLFYPQSDRITFVELNLS